MDTKTKSLMPPPYKLGGRFQGAAEVFEDKTILLIDSIQEARDKEDRLKRFFNNPFNDNQIKFELALICLSYLRQFKHEGRRRKDKVTQDIMHELNQALRCKSLFNSNILPDKVTFQKINGARVNIPEAQQSIELLFCAILLHDLDEDFHHASPENFLNYALAGINKIPYLTDSQKQIMMQQAKFAADSMRALTFGRKVSGLKGKQETHQGDPVIYMSEMQNFWAAIAAKAQDKNIGLGTRFSRVPAGNMSIDETVNYLSETRFLYMSGQPLEDMQERYPELSKYFDILNRQIRIALTCLETLTQHHPDLSDDRKIRGKISPKNAPITIYRHLETAMEAAPWTMEDVCPMVDLMEGLYAECKRHPELMPIYNKILNQMNPFFSQLGTAYKKTSIILPVQAR